MNIKNMNSRYICFDILKCICSFMVVFSHKGIAKGAGPIRSICLVAVPCFFMISGFFYENNKKNNKIDKQIKKVFKLCCFWSLLYLFYSTIHNYNKDILLIDYLLDMFSFERIVKLIAFNYHPMIGVVWYVWSYLYTLIVFNFLYDKKLVNRYVAVVPILLLCCIVFGSYSIYFFNKGIDFYWTRNYLFTGLPCFWLGFIINKYENVFFGINRKTIIVLLSFFIISSIIEYFIFKYNYGQTYGDVFLSTIPLAIILFIGVLSYYRDKRITKFDLLMSDIGKLYSQHIYFIHIIIKNIMDIIFANSYLYTFYKWFGPILIYFVCILLIKLTKKIVY